MDFFNKVKALKSNKMMSAASQNNENEEIIYKVEYVESLENNDEDLKEEIQVKNFGTTLNDEKIDKQISDEIRNFKYLDKLIHSGAKEIILDFDIVLDYDEKIEYVEGINIDVDEITIDGKEHIIDACKKTRIFKITGKNVTLKNISLKNGFSKKNGGAIDNGGKNLLINNALFTDNSSIDGGAIHNTGQMKIINCYLKDNNAFKTRQIEDSIKTLKDDKTALIPLIILLLIPLSAVPPLGWSRGALFLMFCVLMFLVVMLFIKNHGNGGAISSYDNLSIENSILTNNHAKGKGGAVYCGENSNVSLNDINLNNNKSTITVYCDIKSNVLLENSSIKNETNNDNQSIIYCKGHIKILGCEISKNIAQKNIIYTTSYLFISNTHFLENNSKYIINNVNSLEIDGANFINNNAHCIIFNKRGKSLGIFKWGDPRNSNFNCKFIENIIDESIIYNEGKFCIVSKPIFENNISQSTNSKNIFNKTDLTLISPKIEDGCKTILNEGELLIKKSSQDFDSIIEGEYVKFDDLIPTKQKFDFGYLDKKIHESTTNKIILDEDICFEKYERDFYEGGIDLDIDNLIIDGNGHMIDGDNQSRIFIVTGKNIILKNIIFKNGRTHSNFGYNNFLNRDGGAIQSNSGSDIKIIECSFLDNHANNNGGAINNWGELNVFNNAFYNNSSKSGGGIYNNAKLIINDSNFNNNNSESGGAICNMGELNVFNNAFCNNSSKSGGAIYNNAKLLIFGSNFRKNSASKGGAIFTKYKGFKIKNSILQKNKPRFPDEGEHNGIFGKHYKINCKFEKNWDEKFSYIFSLCFIEGALFSCFMLQWGIYGILLMFISWLVMVALYFVIRRLYTS